MQLEALQAVPITEAEAAGFAAKLEAWYATLAPNEQAVLERLLACAERAASEDTEVEGYAMSVGARLTRILAAGVIGAALAAPLAAPVAASANASPVKITHPVVVATPQDLIQGKAAALGAGFTGNPVSGLETVPGGYRIRYQNCDIYYSPSTGACCEVHGGIRLKYNNLTGPWSAFGLPQSDEYGFSDGHGRYNVFANNNSAIVWSPSTGPMLIQGAIHRRWVDEGSDTGPLGYPTSDEIALGGGAAYSDFQNGVLYWDGSGLRDPVTAGLNAQSMSTLLRSYIQKQLSDSYSGEPVFSIDSFSITGISNTGYDLWRCRNRVIVIHTEGSYQGRYGIDYSMDLSLLLFANREADGSTTLRLQAIDSYGLVSGSGDTTQATQYLHNVISNFTGGLYLTRVTVPAIINVLSFKVLPDGGIQLYLQPDAAGGALLTAQAVQFALNRLAQ